MEIKECRIEGATEEWLFCLTVIKLNYKISQ